MSVLLAPSLLAADFLQLEKEVAMVNESQADLFHVDVMDGHFVPNLTFGFFIIKQIKRIAKKPLDVHLMISNPDRYLEAYKDAGADWLSVHYETCPHLHSSIQQIKRLGIKAGVVINPHNPISLLRDIIPDADYVLLMSVNPGFGGQRFIESTYRRLQELNELKAKMNPQLLIEVDGGVDATNAGKLANAGANVLVAGSAVFGADSPAHSIEEIKAAAEK